MSAALLLLLVAQAPEPTARALFEEGVNEVREGRWAAARALFSSAYEKSGRAEILINLGSAEQQLGLLLESAMSYRRFLETAQDERPARRRAVQEALQEVEARIPRVKLVFEGLAEGDVVTLAGAPIDPGSDAVPMNPGSYELTVLRAGARVGDATISAVERSHQVVLVQVTPLERDEPRVVPKAPMVETTAPEPSRTWLWVTLAGVGVVALTAGAVAIATSGGGHEGSLGTWEVP